MRFPLSMLTGLGAVLVVSCGGGTTSSGGGGQGGGTQDPGLPGGGQPPSGHDTNPDGLVYPNQQLGYHARSGSVRGDQIANYKFYGYPAEDLSKVGPVATAGGLQTVALSDFFDPMTKRFKLMKLSVAAVWCGPCNMETDATQKVNAMLAQQGVVFVQALSDGPVFGKGATTGDLSGWITRHGSNFTEMLDPDNQNLGNFFNAAAIPWNAYIDPRSMEILSAGVGFNPDVMGEAGQWLTWVASNPPSYK